MNEKFHGWAATQSGQALSEFEFDPGAMRPEQVQVKVESCGICHSDLSMLDNDWGNSSYPLVPGHEVVGVIETMGDQVKGLAIGDRVGLGWFAGSCMSCHPCMSGHHNLCAKGEQTIVGRHGGFADRVRADWEWAIKLPASLDPANAGPLFCGGITVFGPINDFGVKPTDRVGVIGIGGLGHLALQFLNKWGCEVTAFTSSESKADEARKLGAHHVVGTRDKAALGKLAGSFDFILVTANVALDWDLFIAALAPDQMMPLPLTISGRWAAARASRMASTMARLNSELSELRDSGLLSVSRQIWFSILIFRMSWFGMGWAFPKMARAMIESFNVSGNDGRCSFSYFSGWN